MKTTEKEGQTENLQSLSWLKYELFILKSYFVFVVRLHLPLPLFQQHHDSNSRAGTSPCEELLEALFLCSQEFFYRNKALKFLFAT